MPQVRTAIACQLHLAARTVAAADAARLVQRPIVALLRDSSAAVREALLPGLGETLQVRWSVARVQGGSHDAACSVDMPEPAA